MEYQIKDIKVSNLLLSTENPRFEMVSNQREALSVMIEEQKAKLEKLGQHILKNGTNPSDIPIVTPNKSDRGKFDVLEGNRRVTTLKLLNNPNLINEKHKSTFKKFKSYSDTFAQNPIDEIPCVIFKNEDDAYKWIKLKHTGENEGVGTVTWDAQQKDRFEERNEGKSSYALQVIDFLKKDKDFDASLKKKLPKVPSSSLQRLIGDPDIRKVVGLKVRDGKLTSQLTPDEIKKPLTKIIKDLTSKDFKVKEIYSKSDRLNYIETFKPTDIPDNTASVGQWEIITSTPPKNTSKKSKKKGKRLSTDRNTIIPKSCVIPINQPRINKIYRELKDLDLRYFENAGSILFRVFIELSIDTYIEEKKITYKGRETLANKVGAVSADLVNNKVVTKHEAKPINTAVTNPNSILSINTFNAYVHNKHFSPIPKDLKTTWDGFEKFITKLWEII
ncbi:hypothetical protein [Euzebyella saccharophila]|uniref:ParB/Sulfiredoxin domain-containing protein n=1 Tax=Euzebyella saccharophila TaxID=679664 RepID=A0ABV8JPB3_9FLAO|nr:hypothetical protein [Euzebyella saccharophila]